jgi:hypothetical protein
LKAESRNLFQLSIFLLSAFAFGSVDHRGHYHHEFIGFFFHRQSVHWSNPAFLAEQLQPQLRFIRLLQRTTKFGNKFLPSVFKTCVFLLISAFQISAFQRFSVSAFSPVRFISAFRFSVFSIFLQASCRPWPFRGIFRKRPFVSAPRVSNDSFTQRLFLPQALICPE